MVLAVIGIIYGAVMAYAQTDLKRLVAYTSVSHMGFVLLGIFAWNTLALQGVVLQIVCHALSTGALFILVGALQDRIHTRDMDKMGGLWAVAPRMGGTAMFFALASLGLPGLGNFVAEFLILVGTWQVSQWAAVLGAVGLVFATVYALWMMQRAFQGRETHGWRFADLVPRETGMFAAMIAALVVLGFYPQPLIATARQTVTSVQQIDRRRSPLSRAKRRRAAPATLIGVDDADGGRTSHDHRRPHHPAAAPRAHRGAGGRHARGRVLPLARPRARAHAGRPGGDRRSALFVAATGPPARSRRCSPRHYALLYIGLLTVATAAVAIFSCELPAAPRRAPRGVLRAAAHRHARRRGAGRQHAFRLASSSASRSSASRCTRSSSTRSTAAQFVEAAVKYLVLAGATSAFLAVRHGAGLRRDRHDDRERPRAAAPPGLGGQDVVVALGMVLILVGVGFKLAVVPFHMWTPDVYQGAPAPVTAPTSPPSPRAPCSPCSCATSGR